MGGFKLTKESFSKPKQKTFWDVQPQPASEAEKQLSNEQWAREMRMSEEEAVQVDAKIAEWKENPALSQNVMVLVPKKSVFLTDELDTLEQEKLAKLKQEYEGEKLDKKTASLQKSIKKQKDARKKNALSLAGKCIYQEIDLAKWETKHQATLEGLKGKKKTKHISGLVGKMQDFVNNGVFIGSLDSDAAILQAFKKVLKVEKDLLRPKKDSDFFAEELDDELKAGFRAKYDSYTAVKDFLKKVITNTAQGKKRTAAELEKINSLLGENVLIQGSTAEKIYTARNAKLKKGETRDEKLRKSLQEMDLEAETQELRKNKAKKVPLVNESKKLKEKTKEIQEKWEKQGEEVPVFDKNGKPVMVDKLNPNDYDDSGLWQPFLDKDGNPVKIQKTEAPKKEALRKKLNEHAQKLRFQGLTEKELREKMSNAKNKEEQDHYNNIYMQGKTEVENHISGYSGEAFKYVNNALRYGKYGKINASGMEGVWTESVKQMVDDLKNDISHELPEEVCLTRHSDLGGLACMFGLPYNSVNNVEDLMERIGELPDNGLLVRDKAFLSTTLIKDGVAKGGFRQGQVEFRILAPKGTKGLFIEEMSNYKDTEQELLLDAGTIFRVTKIDASGKWNSERATKTNNKKVIVYMEAIPKTKSSEPDKNPEDPGKNPA
ncbi:MAG: ADP-ribosyltransferase [Lachnospiraceae bacterium]|nr:ADP-ribosyltransferase [Lachnospiraceae bacterium]